MHHKSIKTIICTTLCLVLLSGCKQMNNASDKQFYILAPALPDYSENLTLGDYSNLSYKINDDYTVTEEKVNNALKNKFLDLAEIKHVSDRKVNKTDVLQIAYECTVNNEIITNMSTSDDGVVISLSENMVPEEFENQIVGMSVNETKYINLDFNTDEYKETDIYGKSGMFKTTVLDIMEIDYPDITDEFIQQHTSYTNIDAYKDAIRSELETQYGAYQRTEIISELLLLIEEKTTINAYPDNIIEQLVEEGVSMIENTAAKNAIALNDFLKATYGYESIDEYKEFLTTQAHTYMQKRMILNEIARKENITVTDEEFEKYKQTFADKNGFKSTNNVNLYYRDSELLLDMLTEKIYDWLIEHSTKIQ